MSRSSVKRTRDESNGDTASLYVAVPSEGLKLKFKAIAPSSYRYLHGCKQELQEAFEKADTNGNSQLEPEEFRSVINSLAGFELDELSFTLTMMKADKDGGGSIDYLEFIEFLENKEVTKDHLMTLINQDKDKVRKLFKEADTDGNGSLCRSEFANVLKTIWGGEVHPDVVELVWADVDRDSDGVVDVDEFLRFMEGENELTTSPSSLKKAKLHDLPDPPVTMI